MAINEIANSTEPFDDLSEILSTLHEVGPSDPAILEKLSYYKLFFPEVFARLEDKIISALGLFYKNLSPKSIYSFLMFGFGQKHNADYGEYLTPVQASIRRAIDDSQHISISAPTRAGKSFSIRDFIADQDGDAAVVVPSKSLIAEYVNTMKRKFTDRKDVMISSFVDRVYTNRNLRRIFVITPERSRDLYSMVDSLNIGGFFFDEAQVSEEKERGVIFDVMVRRVKKHFPQAKLIFAHPFIDNPDAQLLKHGMDDESSFSKSYDQGAVGRICVFTHTNGNDYYFSPYIEKGHKLTLSEPFPGSFKDFALNGEHTLLVYVSKASIYKGDFIDGFQDYINNFGVIDNPAALNIIKTISGLLGANKDDHISDLVSLLRKGVVIHHGSVPLEVRFLIEDYIRLGFARICFATSTLAQGVNMPFDVVWLENSRIIGDEAERALSFKNLIGRSGRLSSDNIFDFGYVYTKNSVLFSRRINTSYRLKEVSLIDVDEGDEGYNEALSDAEELIGAIRNDAFDDDKNLPLTKVERLQEQAVLEAAEEFLNTIYREDSIKDSIGGEHKRHHREQALSNLRAIYEASLGRALYNGESAVFDSAIWIFFLSIQGYSFKEIAGLRYSRISRRDEGGFGTAEFSQPANRLPDSNLTNIFSLFSEETLASSVRFNTVIYDTYDYLDTVVSFSLSEVFSAAFKIYNESSGDIRALKMMELLRYGSNDPTVVLLIQYGFPPEDVHSLLPYVESISESNIEFKDEIKTAPEHLQSMTEWYLP